MTTTSLNPSSHPPPPPPIAAEKHPTQLRLPRLVALTSPARFIFQVALLFVLASPVQ